MTSDDEAKVRDILIGESPGIRAVRREILQLARTRLPILLEGPTGSGKELAARAIHLVSRRTGALVAFNVCAVSEGMFEDALFGHVRGAFTGALHDAQGFLAEANGGTVFLDEIGGLALASQAKLLRALETGEFRPVGAGRDRLSDFRMVAASNEGVLGLVGSGAFRADLYHRIGGCVICLPALCERRDDIPTLVRHFLKQFGGAHLDVTLKAMVRLRDHDWPGNVRELRHSMERLVAVAGSGIIDEAAVGTVLRPRKRDLPVDIDRDFVERLQSLLMETGGNTIEVAEMLGVHRATVYRWIRRAGITGPMAGQRPDHAMSATPSRSELRIVP